MKSLPVVGCGGCGVGLLIAIVVLLCTAATRVLVTGICSGGAGLGNVLAFVVVPASGGAIGAAVSVGVSRRDRNRALVATSVVALLALILGGAFAQYLSESVDCGNETSITGVVIGILSLVASGAAGALFAGIVERER